MASHSAIVARIFVNAAMLVPYGILLYGEEQASAWLVIPLLAWGVFAFGQIARFVAIPPYHIPVSSGGYLLTIFAGAIFCAVLGVVIIPILILIDLARLFLP